MDFAQSGQDDFVRFVELGKWPMKIFKADVAGQSAIHLMINSYGSFSLAVNSVVLTAGSAEINREICETVRQRRLHVKKHPDCSERSRC